MNRSGVVPVERPETGGTDARDCLGAAEACFRRAAAGVAGGTLERVYRIGGLDVRLCFAGPALERLMTPAFAHLAVAPRPEAALTVLLWDSETTGTDMPPVPPPMADRTRRNEFWRCTGDGVRLAWNPRNGTFTGLDRVRRLALFRVAAARDLAQYESGSPLLQLLEWWLDDHGLTVIHAGAVGTAGGGVLLAGKGGSGKSTSAVACLAAGLGYVSDDYCLLDVRARPAALSVYNSAKVAWRDQGRFPFLAPALSPVAVPGVDKALFFLHPRFAAQLLPGFPVRAVLVPRVSGRPSTRVHALSPARALLALAPSTVFHFQGRDNRALRSMGALVRQVPCYELELGTDLAGVAGALRPLLEAPA